MNFDNSPSIRLARFPIAAKLMRAVRLLGDRQYAFIQFARTNAITYGDAARMLPLPSESVDVLYSSHMLEHLDREEAGSFLGEARRVLRRSGILRLAVPDLNKQIAQYLESGDADAFIASTELAQPKPRTWAHRVKLMSSGSRNHLWMYDGESLAHLVANAAFAEIRILSAGETTIQQPGALDLHERSRESVYLEARKP